MSVQKPLRQLLHIGEDHLVLILHMLTHLGHILIVEAHDEHRKVVFARAVDRLNEFATDVGQIETQEVFVRLLQIPRQRSERDGVIVIGAIRYEVDHFQKGRLIHAVHLADLADRLVAKSQRDAEASHHENQCAVVLHQIAHLVGQLISFCAVYPIIQCQFAGQNYLPIYK
ncbi:MAG: hypothetical protein IJ296_01010 [Bacteroidales bacterium]|nr:hypothetical protein [Bacteroidales bacterium]